MRPPATQGSLAEWLSWLETLSPKEIELGLERVSAVLARLNLRPAGKVFHVAGTNGKGSTVAMLEALYTQRDATVGSYTSPHLHAFNERIRIDGVAASDEQILQAFTQVEAVRGDTMLTYFEFATLAALCVFEHRGADVLILEVGLGGRLDAVNAVDADAGIITNISLDHCAWLGDDVEKIGAEKAGIFRPGRPYVYAASDMPESIRIAAEKSGASLRRLNADYRFELQPAVDWSYFGQDIELKNLPLPAMRGGFQVQNTAAVLTLLDVMGDHDLLTRQALGEAMLAARLAGRFQIIEADGRWILDVAHNPAAACAFAAGLREMDNDGRGVCIVGMLSDKDVAGVVPHLLPHFDRFIAVTAEGPRAVPAAELARQIANAGDLPCRIVESVEDACSNAAAIREHGQPIAVTGSFMTVGPALRWLANRAS